MTSSKVLLKQLSAAQFAMWEMQLYLDTHPRDAQAKAMHHRYSKKTSMLKREFEEHYGPLTTDSGTGEEWIKNPWPWDLEGCGC